MQEEEVYGFRGPRARWIRWELAVLFAVWLFMFLAPGLPALQGFVYEQYQLTIDQQLFWIGPVALLVWLVWTSGDSFEMFGIAKLRLADLYWSLGLSLLAIAYRIVLGFSIFGNAKKSSGLPAGIESYISSLPVHKVFAGLLLYLPAAAFEELLYRGLMQARIKEITGNSWAAVGATSICFALGHLYQGPGNLPQHLVVGLIFGFCRLKGCSLWVLIFVHALANAFIEVIQGALPAM